MPRTLRAQHQRFALTRPFRIARGVKTAADVVEVTIEEGGLSGRGESIPYPRYGETVDSTLAAIQEVRSLMEAGASRTALSALLPAGAARNAIDCALWDLEARRTGRSVAQLIGAPVPQATPSALTIVIDTPETMAAAARELRHAPLLKVKVDAADPAERIRAVRNAAPDSALIVDPNESWDEALVEAMQPVLLEAGVALLEQPLPAGADDWLEGFTPVVPICADESVHVAGHRADRVEAGGEWIHAVERNPAPRGLQTGDAAAGCRDPHRAAGVTPERDVGVAGDDRDRRPTRGSAGYE